MNTCEVHPDYELVVLTAKDKDLAHDIIRIYRNEEPLSDYIGMTIADLEEILLDKVSEWLAEELSVAVIEKSSGNLAGALLGATFKESDPMQWGSAKPTSEKAKMYAKIAGTLETSVNLCKLYGVTKGMDHCLLAVHKEHRGKGIAKAMAKKLENIAREKGLRLQAVTASNAATNKIYSKMGFRVICDKPYSEFEFNGAPLFKELASNGTTSITQLAKIEA